LDIEASNIAFVANLGLGLEIKVSEELSLLPEVRYSPFFTTVKYGVDIPYIGYAESTKNSFIAHNIQFLVGIKYTF